MIKTFNIFRNKEKKSPNSPDYSISIKNGDKYTIAGSCWLKDGKDGQKYFSCKLSDGYKDVKGFSVTRDTDTKVEEAKEEQPPF